MNTESGEHTNNLEAGSRTRSAPLPSRETLVMPPVDVSDEIAFFEDQAVDSLARLMVETSARVRPGERVLVSLNPGGRQLASRILARCLALGAEARYRITDPDLDVARANASSLSELERPDGLELAETQWADVVFIIYCPRDASYMSGVSPERQRAWQQARQPARAQRVYGTRWTLVYWPTSQNARDEEMTLAEYAGLFFHACAQPWGAIRDAQERLIGILDAGHDLRLVAGPPPGHPNRPTDLVMDITEMTFANSTINRNVPGSEVFSAPIRESVNGTFFGPGKYYADGRAVRDIWLRFEGGRIVDFDAGEGRDALEATLNTDEGARYLGEVALGTNPGLTRRMVNPLLAEKAAGSFHVALGAAYEYTSYEGKPVRLDNGNRSKLHWDVTRVMTPGEGGGRVEVDGQVIQRDGLFTLPDLAALNPPRSA